jgi:hypothetical protein
LLYVSFDFYFAFVLVTPRKQHSLLKSTIDCVFLSSLFYFLFLFIDIVVFSSSYTSANLNEKVERMIDRESKKMYFDKRSPLINYIAENAIVYSISTVAGEKDRTTTTTDSSCSRCRSLVVCGTLS